jgi:hypothetical protein
MLAPWSAAPFARGEIAFDLFAATDYPAGLRATFGLLQPARGGIDLSFAIRTMGWLTESELRARFGYRFLDGRVAIDVEAAPFSAFGFDGQFAYGGRLWVNASVHSRRTTDPDRLGAVAFTLGVGVEAMHDGLAGLVQYASGNVPLGPSNFAACDGSASSANPCEIVSATDAAGNQVVVTGARVMVRPLARAAIEVGLGRHVNVFAGVERVLAANDALRFHRPYFELFWNFAAHDGRADLLTYVRLGATYKF